MDYLTIILHERTKNHYIQGLIFPFTINALKIVLEIVRSPNFDRIFLEPGARNSEGDFAKTRAHLRVRAHMRRAIICIYYVI